VRPGQIEKGQAVNLTNGGFRSTKIAAQIATSFPASGIKKVKDINQQLACTEEEQKPSQLICKIFTINSLEPMAGIGPMSPITCLDNERSIRYLQE
jgi:hypothetical protein